MPGNLPCQRQVRLLSGQHQSTACENEVGLKLRPKVRPQDSDAMNLSHLLPLYGLVQYLQGPVVHYRTFGHKGWLMNTYVISQVPNL